MLSERQEQAKQDRIDLGKARDREQAVARLRKLQEIEALKASLAKEEAR